MAWFSRRNSDEMVRLEKEQHRRNARRDPLWGARQLHRRQLIEDQARRNSKRRK